MILVFVPPHEEEEEEEEEEDGWLPADGSLTATPLFPNCEFEGHLLKE